MILLPLTFALSAILTFFVRRYSISKKIIDIPNERSSHSVPTPRGGGLAIFLALTFATTTKLVLSEAGFQLFLLLFFSSSIALIGWLDDKMNLSAKTRLCVQVFSASSVTASFLYFENSPQYTFLLLGIFSLLTVLFIVWMTNLYNFMDGVDGFASVQVISVSILTYLFIPNSIETYPFIFLLVGASTAGFLIWNWQPAKIFMGDVGSAFLGFFLAGLSVYSFLQSDLSIFVILILHASFIGDATQTLLTRAFYRQKLHQAHKTHLYQKLVQSGHSHQRTSLYLLAYNTIWLFPIALAQSHFPSFSLFFLAAAYLPLSLYGLIVGSGRDALKV